MILRPYQEAILDKLRAGFAAGHQAQILYLPTGGGKTEVAISLMNATAKKFKRAAMVLDRIVLCDQTSKRLDKWGIDHGVMQSGHWRYRPYERIQVCSAQTLEKRGSFPGLNLLIIDECHTQRQQTLDFIKGNPDVKVIGLTATPFTDGLSATYSNVVCSATTEQLKDDGFLVPLKVFISKEIDMTGAKKVAGEWSQSEAGERGIKITGDVVAEWVKKTTEIFGGPRKTIVFCANVAHGADLAQKFADAGFNFVPISYKDTDEFKRDAVEDFSKPDTAIHGLIACDILTKGFDVPDVMIGVSARPFTKSLSSHVQQMGRVMRPSPDKEFALWLDHCIASGQRVLTQRGLVPIEEILVSDTLWDGHDFVTHKGVVSRGTRPVIRYAGLTATADHPVKTNQGWRALGYCAEEQTPVVTTGVGRKTLRERRNHFTAGSLAGGQRAALHACALRVRDLWLSVCDLVFQPDGRAHQGVQGLQSAEALSHMAVRAGRRHEGAMHEPERRGLSQLWRAGDRIQVRLSDFMRSLDSSELRLAAQCEGLGVGSQGQQRALRAGQYSVGDETRQHEQPAHHEVDSADAQVQTGVSQGSVFRRIASSVLDGWNDLRGNRRTVCAPVTQAERQVWDILEAGPRNCFTCEGLLVHNSGNYLRFREDWDVIYQEGVSELHDDREKPKKEKTDKEKKEAKCPVCGHLWPGNSDTCPSCGHVRVRRSEIAATPGELIELDGMQSKADRALRQRWFSELSGIASERGYQSGWVAHKYREKFGMWPRNLSPVPMSPSIDVMRWEKSRRIAWAKGKHAA